METIESVNVSFSQNPLYLGVEAEVRRRLFLRVQLEILRDRINAISEDPKQRRVCRLGRHYTARQQHDAMASRHGRDPTPVVVTPSGPPLSWVVWNDIAECAGGPNSQLLP